MLFTLKDKTLWTYGKYCVLEHTFYKQDMTWKNYFTNR